jgi:hypothetical protein
MVFVLATTILEYKYIYIYTIIVVEDMYYTMWPHPGDVCWLKFTP